MSAPLDSLVFSSGTRPRTQWLLVAVHCALLVAPPTIVSFGVPAGPPTASPLVAYPLAGAILILQLRHSLAFARDERPRHALWTYLALVALVYLPMKELSWGWANMQMCVMASGVMILGWRLGLLAIAIPLIGTDLVSVQGFSGFPRLYVGVYWTLSILLAFIGLYGSPWLVRLIDELRETRAELAALAVDQERRRISRDLHDLLGQSLSAVSLKGDLAIRLLRRDPQRARQEIESLTELARETQRGIRSVSRDEHAVSLQSEAEGAVALLSAAGVDTQVDMNLAGLEPPVERILAWAVREGAANALRHSRAQKCSITAGRRDRHVFLEMVNDGVQLPAGQGTGLSGLAERARTLAGSSTYRLADGNFRLLVELPDGAA